MRTFFHTVQTKVPPEYFFWAAAFCSLFFVLDIPDSLGSPSEAAAVAVAIEQENPFDSVELSAKAAYVYDMKTQKPLFAKNEMEALPLASITKIMTAATALSFIPETTYITIGSRAIQEEGDSGLNVGERWLLRDLITFTLLESSNDGAVAISTTVGGILATSTESVEDHREIFIGEMNRLAQDIGLAATSFSSESGLDLSETDAGALSSAADTSRMLAYALEEFPSAFKETRWSELLLATEDGAKRTAQNTNKEVSELPLLLASKTGYTDLAGGNLVVAFDAAFNHPIIVTVLGSTAEGRFTDVEKLVWSALEYLAQSR